MYQGEYLELTLKDQTYYFSNHEIPQGEESKLLNLLKAYNTKKFLLHDFTMGDIMKFGSSVQENSFKFYFIDKNNEIKQIIFA